MRIHTAYHCDSSDSGRSTRIKNGPSEDGPYRWRKNVVAQTSTPFDAIATYLVIALQVLETCFTLSTFKVGCELAPALAALDGEVEPLISTS
jgi:hypothetical protein